MGGTRGRSGELPRVQLATKLNKICDSFSSCNVEKKIRCEQILG